MRGREEREVEEETGKEGRGVVGGVPITAERESVGKEEFEWIEV